jgi:hypothetical protein
MKTALDLIEAGTLPHRHSHACVVVDEAEAAEVELSFFDYQRQAYIGESGLSPQPFFFHARKRMLADGRAGYVVGSEVTRFLRRDARFGVASREGRLGDVRCKVRTYGADVAGGSAIGFGATEKLHAPPPPSSHAPNPAPVPAPCPVLPPPSVGSNGSPQPPSEVKSTRMGRKRAALSPAILIAILVAVVLAGLFPMLGLMGIIGWETSPDKISFEEHAEGEFSPPRADVVLRRAWYMSAIERLLFPRQNPFVQDGAPAWLKFESASYDDATGSWRLRLSASGASSQAAEGENAYRLQLRFPLASRNYKGTEISLRVGHAEPKLTVSPSQEVVLTRSVEGGFSPTFVTFDVRNTGAVSAKWRVYSNVDWLEIVTTVDGRTGDSLDGNLPAGGNISVAIRPNRAADHLQNGTESLLTIENIGANERIARTVRIAVAPKPPELPIPLPSPRPPALAQLKRIVSFDGLWSTKISGCSKREDVNFLGIGRTRLSAWETDCQIASSSIAGESRTLNAKCSGEGEKWRVTFKLKMTGEKMILSSSRDKFRSGTTYVRCK